MILISQNRDVIEKLTQIKIQRSAESFIIVGENVLAKYRTHDTALKVLQSVISGIELSYYLSDDSYFIFPLEETKL